MGMQEGMVITVEPGFYFIDYLIEELQDNESLSKFVNTVKLAQFWDEVGGVRIEDDVVITSDGCRVLTRVPREINDIEDVMAGKRWSVTGSSCRTYVAS